MRLARQAGITLVEVMLGVSLAVVVIGGGLGVTNSAGELSRSASAKNEAARRVDCALRAFVEEVRHASLGTALKSDGSAFPDGEGDSGLSTRRVLGYEAGVQLAPAATLRFVPPAGGAEGRLTRTVGAAERTVVRGITNLTVTRSVDSFVVTVTARSGPADDRGRTARGSVTLRCRNP